MSCFFQNDILISVFIVDDEITCRKIEKRGTNKSLLHTADSPRFDDYYFDPEEKKKKRLCKCQSSSTIEHQIENVIISVSSALSSFSSFDDARSLRMLFDLVVQRRIDFDSSLICTSTKRAARERERERDRNRISVVDSSTKDN